MTIPDTINAVFESLAGLMLLRNCAAVRRDKEVKGVCVIPTTFFALWGFWNLYFYPAVGQWISFLGGLSVTAANTYYVYLLIQYTKQNE